MPKQNVILIYPLFQTITTLNKLGLCVSPSASAKEKQELQKRQMKHIDRLMLEEKEEVEK